MNRHIASIPSDSDPHRHPVRPRPIKALCLRAAQQLVIATARPYTLRELPGWGKIYKALVGHRRGWFWEGAAIRTTRGKLHHHVMRLDLSKWPDRSAYFLGRWYDLETQLLASDLLGPGDTVIDVGANRGMFTLLASHLVGDAGQVIAFEPNPTCVQILEDELTANNIHNVVVHRFGLGDRGAELTMSVPFGNFGEGTFGASAYRAELTYQVRAAIAIGDQILAGENPSFIKIDVEGFECSVIAGLAATINRLHPIILTEVIQRQLKACDSSAEALMSLMAGFGYRGFRLGLKKDGRRYRWRLAPLRPEDIARYVAGFDVVWHHPGSDDRLSALIESHVDDESDS